MAQKQSFQDKEVTSQLTGRALQDYQILDYVIRFMRQDLSEAEVKYIRQKTDTLKICRCLEYANPHRAIEFWRDLVIDVCCHFHPNIREVEITDAKARECKVLLVKSVKKVLGPRHGFYLKYEALAHKPTEGVTRQHFHLHFLPFHISEADLDKLKNDQFEAIQDIRELGIHKIRDKNNKKKVIKRVNRWFDARLFSTEEVQQAVDQFKQEWVSIQRKVFRNNRGLSTRNLQEKQLVSIDSDSVNAVNPLLRSIMDTARIARYRRRKLKYRGKLIYKFDDDTGMVLMENPRGRTYTPLEFFRNFMYAPPVMRADSYGLLRSNSPFVYALDTCFIMKKTTSSIFYWLTLPLDRLKRAIAYYNERELLALINECKDRLKKEYEARNHKEGYREFCKMFILFLSGKYSILPDYLEYLVKTSDRINDRKIEADPKLKYKRVPLSVLYRASKKDEKFSKWKENNDISEQAQI